MNSPFPGMDPYLEQHGRDVHTHLIAYACDALNAGLPSDLVARSEERVAVEAPDQPLQVMYPDVNVKENADTFAPSSGGVSGVAVAEPVVMEVLDDVATERFIHILDVAGSRVITVIEFLSPSNKRGAGLEDYQQKRSRLLEGSVHLVEIDLIREGDWRAIVRPGVVPVSMQTAYRVVIRRANRRRRLEYIPMSLRKRLPIIPIPLRPTDRDTTLDMQSLVDQVYRNGRYASLDYSKPSVPQIEGDDAAWAEELLKQSGRRE